MGIKVSKFHDAEGGGRIDRNFHPERFHPHMHLAPVLIHPVEGPACFRGEMGDMITVVGKRTTGFQNRTFAHNFVALNHGGGAVLIDQDPFPAKQGDGVFGEVVYGDKILNANGHPVRQIFLCDEFV